MFFKRVACTVKQSLRIIICPPPHLFFSCWNTIRLAYNESFQMDAYSFGAAQVYNRGARRWSLAPRCEHIIQIGPSEEGIGGSPGAHGYITALTRSSKRHFNYTTVSSSSLLAPVCESGADSYTPTHPQNTHIYIHRVKYTWASV